MNDVGEMERVRCTRYVAHSDYGTDKQPRVEYTIDKKSKEVYIQNYPNTNYEKDEQTHKVNEETSI